MYPPRVKKPIVLWTIVMVLALSLVVPGRATVVAAPATDAPQSPAKAYVPQTDDHLYLCEAVLTPTENEYVEIFNPTGSTVDLTDYYLSDSQAYPYLPGQFGAGPPPSVDSTDFIARFPAATTLPPGGVLVIAFDGAGFQATFGFAPDFEIFSNDPGVPDMLEAYAGSIGSSAGLTNSGEQATLFYWDGASDLVADVDMTNLGTPSSTNTIANKTGVAVDGPDGDTTPTTYLTDAFTMPQQSSDPGFGVSTKRIAQEAGNEQTGGGNGLTGDDETTENILVTWDSVFTAPNPGICEAVPLPRMVLNEVVPKGTEWVELYNGGTAPQDLMGWYVTDTACGAPASTIGAATLNPGEFFVVNSGDPGDNFNLDNSGDVVILCDATDAEVDHMAYGTSGGAPLAPFASDGPQYSAARVVDGQDSGNDAVDWNLDPTPTQGSTNDVAGNDLGSSLIINELDIFPASGNDFVELYNPTGSDVDVSGWFLSDGDDVAILNPGLTVPAGGWLALEETVDWTTEGTTGVDLGGSDVAYLFDTGRVRVDQLGWTNGPFITACVARVPDGAGPNVGFDWPSSGGDVTLFDQACSMGSSNGGLPPAFVINEILADPDLVDGDANGDGVVDTSDDEFVEIVNNSGEAVDISGWTLSDGVSVRHTFPADTVIPDQCVVVVFGGGTPTGDFGYATVQTASTGALGLNNSGDTVTLNDGVTDVVSYTYGSEGGNNQSLTRDPDITGPDPLVEHSTATGSGGALFSPGTLIDGTPFSGCLNVCGLPATLVHDIQGSGLASPEVGNTHTVEAVVVADFQEVGSIRGFYVQEDDAEVDGDPATSEGLFIYDNYFNVGGVDVNVGDLVRVSGTVAEYANLTELSPVSSVQLCAGNPPATASAVTLPLSEETFPERYEGMLVEMPQTLFVTENYDLGRGGVVTLSSDARLLQPTNVVLPGAPAIALQAANDLNQIILDDGSTQQNPDPIIHPAPTGLTALDTLRGADTVTGLQGVLTESWSGWSGTDAYRIHPFGGVAFTPANPRPAAPDPTEVVDGSLHVASFNVLNYFTTIDNGQPICGPNNDQDCRGADSASEFTRQRDKIINAISTMDVDIVGLIELENTTGAAVLQDLVDGLNAATAPGTYDFVDTGTIGGDAIKVGLIYKPAMVRPVGPYAILDSSVDPTFDDTKNRPVLAQTFEELASGGRFTVAVNHLKSKGSCPSDPTDPNADQGDGQSCWNPVRIDAANAEVNWLATDPTGTGDPDFIIMGDLNSYAMEDPIAAIEGAGYTNLISTYAGPEAYSYVYFGQAGYLDHGLSNPDLTPQVSGATVWHINADEPSVLDYNEEYKSPGQLISLYNADPYRASDHDPVVVGLNLAPSEADLWIDKVDGPDPVTVGDTLVYTLTTQNNGPDLALDVAITDVLPSGVTFVDATAYTGSCAEAGGTVTCDMDDVGAGAIETVVITVTTENVPCGTLLTNFAEVRSSTADGNPDNDSDQADTLVTCELAVDVSKDVIGPTEIELPGGAGAVSYTVAYTNTSPVTGTITFEDQPAIDFGTVNCVGPDTATLGAGMAGSQEVACAVQIEPDLCEPITATLQNVVTATVSLQWSAAGDSVDYPNADQDVYAFAGVEGAALHVLVDTVDAATAFDIEACVSTTDSSADCFAFGDDQVACTFPPPAFGCPAFSTTLPADTDGDGLYYLLVEGGSDNYATPGYGEYLAMLSGNPATSDLVLVADNQPGTFAIGGKVPAASPLPAAAAWWSAHAALASSASAPPVTILVPPTDPTNPQCQVPNIVVDPLSLSSLCQEPDTQVVQTLTISNTGQVPLSWLIDEEPGLLGADCVSPADVPWLSVDPISGTTPANLAIPVDVTFDSTGLAVDTYTANLCISSDDPNPGPGNETDLVIVPVTLTVCPPTAVVLADLAAGDAPAPVPSPVPAALPAAALPAVAGLAMAAAYWLRRR